MRRSRRPGGVIVLQKGRILLTRVVPLSAALILAACPASLSAPAKPFSRPVDSLTSAYSSAGLLTSSGRTYIGMERPDWLFATMRARAAAKQGPGPIPDIQLTPTATASEEFYANSAPYGELNRIVISSNGVDEDGDGQFDPGVVADDFNLWLLRVDGSLATQLTDATGDELYPAYSPGARLVAFSSNASGTWQIYTVEVLTGTIRQITSSPGNKYHPTWSPDSSWIVFSGDAAGNRDLYIIPSDGSQLPQAITQTPEDETQPTWAPAGDIASPILFTRSGAGGSRIFRIGSDGTNEQPVTNGGGNPSANDSDPTWRHNTQLIAFASDRPIDAADLTTDYNIWTVSPAGEDVTPAQLRSNLNPADTHDDRYPAFNPGLRPRQPVRIFFTSSRPDAVGPNPGAEPDIWRFELSDPVPPELEDLPSVDAPRRFVSPGSDVTIHVPVFDRDSGVQAVVAEIKDPDSAVDDSLGIEHKLFSVSADDHSLYTQTSGHVYRELDCDTVGQTELFDDGDPAHGDAEAGDGIFSGVWTTPPSPSDYIIDIHVQDVAGNAFEYDDIYGFTTEMFQPTSNVLFVNDYCEGQEFIWAASGANNDWPTSFPVESYYTTNMGGDNVEGDRVAFNTFRDLGWFRDGIWLGEPYDIWRVICRGPIEMTDLIYYLPTKEVQLTVPDLLDTREVLVADRAVVWAAPHTGDEWVGPGSLVDATTQATLSMFLDRGGRLMISGQDIGFALTLDGTSPNNFYTNYLHAQYIDDDAPSNMCGRTTVSGVDGDPIVAHPFSVYYQIPEDLQMGWHQISNVCYAQDCAHYTEWPDEVQAVGGAVATHVYDAGGNDAGIRYADPAGGYRVVYFAWGFEQTHRYYRNPATGWGAWDAGQCGNNRAKTLHNTLCWLRTGGFQGRVLSISDGNQPINDPTPVVRVSGGGYEAAVRCEEDGRYVIGGLPPGVYRISAVRPGFEIDHADGRSCHGGLPYPTIDFAIARAEPGAVRGTITSLATGEPLAAVEVCAYEGVIPEPEDGEDGQTQAAQNGEIERGELYDCTTTAADGTYSIGNITPGQVIVEADGSSIGYGTEEALTTVTSGNTTTVDLALSAAPGTITATVTDMDGNPLEDATVEVFTDGQLAGSGTTDVNGEASVEVQPGDYNVEASRPGFQRSQPEPVSIMAGETEEVTIPLQGEPPGSVSGLVARGITGEAVGGIVVELVVNENIIDTTVTTATTSTAGDGTAYNYRFATAPTGQITVRPDPVGFTVSPAERIVTVQTGEETTGVNFAVSSIRTFPAGLQLISLPYDYPNTDPAELLDAGPNLKLATWEPTNGRYAIYPATPADRFRLGSGYWLKLSQVRELSREGIEAEDVYELPLAAGSTGWHLVGDFFTEPIDFYSLQVRDRNGVVRNMQQAMAAGLVRSPLFAYLLGGYATSAVAEPFVGYWLNIGDDVTIVGDRRTDTLAADEQASRPAVAAPDGGWLMPVVVCSGEMTDAATWVGCAPGATGGFDAGMDMLKPPPPSIGSSVYAAAVADASYAVDVRPADAADVRWTLRVQGPAGQPLAVRWPDLSDVPEGVRPVLVDAAANAQLYMRTSSCYEFTAGEGARDLEIRLIDQGAALAVSAASARAAGQGAAVSYTLSADAQVTVTVMNIAGRPVAAIADGEIQAAGTQRVVWDGMTGRGTKAPGGVYLVAVQARSDDGQQAQAITTLALGR